VTPGAFQQNKAGADDVFVARLSADGSQVLASTYLGGGLFDLAYHVEVEQDGSIWVGGSESSSSSGARSGGSLGVSSRPGRTRSSCATPSVTRIPPR